MTPYSKNILSSFMLGILFLILFSFTSCLEDDSIVNSNVYNDDIEYYIYDQNGKELHYTKCKHRIAIYVNPEEKFNEVLDEIKKQVTVDYTLSKIIWASIDSTRTDIVENIKSIKNVESVHYFVMINDGFFQVASNAINLKTKSDVDINKVLEKLKLTSLINKIEHRPFMDEPRYTVYFTTTNLDFYKLSRDLYKTGLCVYASPDFLIQIENPYLLNF